MFSYWGICEKTSDNCWWWFIREAACWCKCINYWDKFSWLEHCINQQMIWNLCGINCICLCRCLVSEQQSFGASKHAGSPEKTWLPSGSSSARLGELIPPASSKIQQDATVIITCFPYIIILWSCIADTIEPGHQAYPNPSLPRLHDQPDKNWKSLCDIYWCFITIVKWLHLSWSHIPQLCQDQSRALLLWRVFWGSFMAL